MEEFNNNQINKVEIARDLPYHNHDGVNSAKIPARYIIPAFIFTPTQLTAYLAGPATDGDCFSVFEGTNYYFYVRINNAWKKATLS